MAAVDTLISTLTTNEGTARTAMDSALTTQGTSAGTADAAEVRVAVNIESDIRNVLQALDTLKKKLTIGTALGGI